jgi:hypothetical protein
MSQILLKSSGKFKLEQRDEGYIILNGTKICKKYSSLSWANKKYNRLTSIFIK